MWIERKKNLIEVRWTFCAHGCCKFQSLTPLHRCWILELSIHGERERTQMDWKRRSVYGTVMDSLGVTAGVNSRGGPILEYLELLAWENEQKNE